MKASKDSCIEKKLGPELQMLLDAFPFYVMLLDAEHKILMANEAIQGDLSLVPEQIIGQYCPKAVHGLDEPYPGCPLEEAIEKGHGVEREFFDSDNDRWLNSSIYPTKMDTKNGQEIFIHFISDISDKKQTEAEIERNLEIQTTINKVLRLSLEDIPLEEMLARTIDLILSIPWLALDSKGGIFLVEENSKVLNMKSQRGLSKALQTKCARVPFGKCLCGQAALTREVQFADCIDDRHETRYHGISSHGHYCVPILFEGKTLGVINLYLREGHRRDQKEEDFLTAISNTLAGVIVRKRNDHKLKGRETELKINNKNLEEMNSALNVLLRKRDEDRKQLNENVFFNAKKLLLPYVDKLKNSKMNSKQARYVNILESNLNNMISPIAQTLSNEHFNLTPIEVQIADLVKQGKSSKEIADIFIVSVRTIEYHRQNIRKKLGLKQKKSNLRTYLLSLK